MSSSPTPSPRRAVPTPLAVRSVASGALVLGLAAVGAVTPALSASAADPFGPTVTDDAPQASSESATTVADPCNPGTLGLACGSATTMRYGRAAPDGSGEGIGQRLTSFEVGGDRFGLLPIDAGRAYAEVLRVPNPAVTSARDSIFVAGTAVGAPTTVSMSDPLGLSEADVFLSDVVTRGIDNTFANSPATAVTFSDIERISLLRSAPIVTPNPGLVGVAVVERGGSDDVTVAAVTAVDAAGQPTAWGPTVKIPAAGNWGPILTAPTTVLGKDAADPAYRPIDATQPQPISGMYISFAELSVAPGAPVYGISLVGNDESTVGEQGANLATDGTAQGSIDLIGGLVAAAVPVGVPDATTGPQGQPQTVVPVQNDIAPPDQAIDPTETRLLDPSGAPLEPGTPLVIPDQGTYTLDPATGSVTFTPLPGFVGTATPARYQVIGSLGAVLESTYTPAFADGGAGAGGAAPAGPGGEQLPATGADPAVGIEVAAALLTTGALAIAVRATRRRGTSRQGLDPIG